MSSVLRQRMAFVLLVLVTGWGLFASRVNGCGGSAVPFCSIERLAAPPPAALSVAAVPAPFKLVFVELGALLFFIGRDPLPASARARIAWHRRYTEPRLPRGVPWGDAHVPYAYAMRDP